MATTLEEINDAFKRYYKLHGVKYEDQFKNYWEDNGFDDLHEEITTDISDSMLLEFTDNIPFKKEPEDKKQAIYDLLLKIYRNPQCDFYEESTLLKVSAEDWKLTREQIKRVNAVHDEQLITIWIGDVQRDKNLLALIAISQKIGVPYLLYLVDLYNRDRLSTFKYAKSKHLSEMEWVNKNRYCFSVRKTNESAVDTIKHGINSFFLRFAPKFKFKNKLHIEDSLKGIAKYIAAQIDFVHKMAQQNQTSCPFQFDAVVIFDKVQQMMTAAQKINMHASVISVDEDEDDDTDGDDDDDCDTQQQLNEAKFVDVIGNIKHRLKSERLVHQIAVIPSAGDDAADEKSSNAADKTPGFRVKRAYHEMFRHLKEKLIDKKGKEYENYPRNHRFCSLVDRREPNGENEKYEVRKEDEMIFYEPPHDCCKIPKKAVDLWYFDSSKTCILPNNGYSTGVNKDGQLNIASDQSAFGAMLMLSFHVLSVNEIRAYLYWNGKAIRFLPQDIIDLLPLIFVESRGNEKFAKSIEAKRIVNDVKNKLIDQKFNEFCATYAAKK